MGMENGYNSAGTIGGKLGCLAATLVGLPVFGFLMFLSFYGNCGQNDPCQDGQGVRFFVVFGVTAAVSAVVGFTIRSMCNKRLNRGGK